MDWNFAVLTTMGILSFLKIRIETNNNYVQYTLETDNGIFR